MLNTCKSNGLRRKVYWKAEVSGGRVSNTWVICPADRDNRVKTLLIPDKLTGMGILVRKGEIR